MQPLSRLLQEPTKSMGLYPEDVEGLTERGPATHGTGYSMPEKCVCEFLLESENEGV